MTAQLFGSSQLSYKMTNQTKFLFFLGFVDCFPQDCVSSFMSTVSAYRASGRFLYVQLNQACWQFRWQLFVKLVSM